jgi:methyl-galactoside transport system substrate-binding protein
LDSKLDSLGVKYQDYDANSNQTTQNEQIDTAIQTGANLLIVNIVTSGSVDASQQIVDKANAAGVPVILTAQWKARMMKEKFLAAMTSAHS